MPVLIARKLELTAIYRSNFAKWKVHHQLKLYQLGITLKTDFYHSSDTMDQ